MPSQEALFCGSWYILLAVLTYGCTGNDLLEWCRLRWSIEVHFKVWKQTLNLNACLLGVVASMTKRRSYTPRLSSG